MKRVLVVDDEFLVRLGLRTTMDWEAHGYEIVGEASNGREALEMFDEADPDILLTDIKMPVMDGFKLIEEARKRKKNLQVVILSHYDEFTYVQKALEFGAVQYILKSEMNEQKLIDLLQKLSLKDKSQPVEEPDIKAESENYLKDLLFGKAPDDDFTAEDGAAPPAGLFSGSAYIAIRGFCETSMLHEDSRKMLSKTVKTIVDKAFSDASTVMFFYKDQLYFTSIVNAKDGSIITGLQDAVKAMQQLIRNIRQYFEVVVQVGLSMLGKPERFPAMIGEAELARKVCFFSMQPVEVFYPEMARGKEKHIRISRSKLSSFIDEKDKAGLKEYILGIFNELKSEKSYGTFKNAVIDLLSVARTICEEQKIDQTSSLSPAKFSHENCLVMPFIDNAETYMQELYAAIADAAINHESGYSALVQNTIAYIRSNYSKNISLSDAAEAAEVSSSYLSLIFKQETGVNFSNYLTDYRMEMAKKMLVNTNKKIYEIAEDIGFSSPYYFSKVFKEYTGLTCKEYKDKNAGRR
ncbi:MAG: response regulator [Clostridiaceae bacterium]|jgi:two-component system response regulator YesN|nr:response regulator [Clostridiaceae bacterium]